jgi:hypothetical protein
VQLPVVVAAMTKEASKAECLEEMTTTPCNYILGDCVLVATMSNSWASTPWGGGYIQHSMYNTTWVYKRSPNESLVYKIHIVDGYCAT